MREQHEEQADPREARIADIRAKLERGEEPTPEDKEFLRSEGIDSTPSEGAGPPPL